MYFTYIIAENPGEVKLFPARPRSFSLDATAGGRAQWLHAQEQNEKVLTAATRTLDDIRRAPHAIAAKADALLKSEQMLPLPPLEK